MRELLWLMRSRFARGGATAMAPPPSLESVSPTSGSSGGGTTITLRGNLLDGVTRVLVDGVDCTNVVRQGTRQCQAVTPAGALGAVTVQALTAGGAGVLTGAFTYVGTAPTVTNVSPSAGPAAGGTPITVTGTNFTGATAVKINGVDCTSIIVVGPTTITCVTPAGAAGAQTCAVTTPSGTGSLSSAYTYVAAPTVTSVTKSVGDTAGGFSVDIGGTNFIGVTSVQVGGVSATSVVVNSSISITCTFPAGSAGAATIAVTGTGGTGSNGALFTYFSPATLTLTGWWRSYAGTSPWNGTASAGSSGSNTWTGAGGSLPANGTALNGKSTALFDGTNDEMTASGTPTTYLSTSAWTISVLVRLSSAAAPGVNVYDNAALLTDGNAAFGADVSSSGFKAHIYDGGAYYETAWTAAGTGSYHLLQAYYDGTNIYHRVDSGSWSAGTASGAISGLAASFFLGRNWNGGAFLAGTIAEVITASSVISRANLDNVKAYVNTRYNLSL